MSKYCNRCGFENPSKDDVITWYEGKVICDCENGNFKGKKIKLIINRDATAKHKNPTDSVHKKS